MSPVLWSSLSGGSHKTGAAATCPRAGLAVIAVMLMTTSLVSLVMIICWEWHLLVVGVFWLVWTFIEAAYLSSNLEKVASNAPRWACS
jgi:K+ transporter